jgi:Excalibur calcium-binding domain
MAFRINACRTGLAALLIAGAVGVGMISSAPVVTPTTAQAADRDCNDFRTQKKAQRFFRRHNPRRDPHGLDSDNDRIVCEENRCPCTRRWHRQHDKLTMRRE